MQMRSSFAALMWLTCLQVAAAEPAADGEVFFRERVLPLLEKRCFECHSHAGDIEGGLALDSRSGWEQGGDSGPALVAGKPDHSLVVKAVRYADPELQMPPDGKLSAAEIAVLERWIAAGAPAPAADPAANQSQAKRAVDIAAGKNHWAFRPVVAAAPPAVRDASWPRDDVDRFLLARLEQAGLRPTADAGRHAWLRRVSFDLTGLPPTPAEIAAYMADASPSADATVVDRLLASRAFGERWARHWLDLTGYADQMGTSNNVFAEHAWRYRDYLIDAFNADKSYDRFIREQIAGDLLPDTDPAAKTANLVATGFLVLGDVEIVNVDKMKLDWDLADQQITKVGTAFLGMTLGCVRCHDHKFDPIGLEDYYGLAGVFLNTKSVHKIPYGVWSKVSEVELPETERQAAARLVAEQKHRERVADLKSQRDRLQARQKEIGDQLKSVPAGDGPGTKTADTKTADTKTAASNPLPSLRAELQKEQERITAEIGSLNGTITHAEFFAPRPPHAHGVREAEKHADAHVAIRGNPRAAGPVVPRGVLRVASWSHPPPMPADQSGRLQVAEWIADPLNPLTARVAVNRIWQKLFGAGIVRSVDYFGTRGDSPTHPELLDRLAADFVRDGWSQKRLIRRLVLSRAYRMGSGHDATAAARDPDNLLLWRMNRRRLDAEAIRDGILLVSGRLIDSSGGPSLPLEYQENTGGLTGNVNPPAFALRKFRAEQEFERTVYLPIVRAKPQAGPARLREVFDFTQPATFAGMRSQTVVPTQSLYLLNDSLLRARAADTARLAVAAAGDRDGRLEHLWLRVLNRPITRDEASTASAFLDRLAPLLAGSKQPEQDAWVELCHGLLSTNEFLHEL